MQDQGAALWRAVLDPASPLPDAWQQDPPAASVAQLENLITPALAEFALKHAADNFQRPLVDPDNARKSRLLNRFTGNAQRHWASEIARSGMDVTYLKGFVFAHTLYPDPDFRTIGDLDLLVRKSELDDLLGFLLDRGFGFQSNPLPRWGFISDASFVPLVSDDETCNIDVHIQPDCYPAYRSLTTEQVFRDRRSFSIGDEEFWGPSIEHAIVLCLTNAAKDKFGPYSVRKLLDLAVLIGSDVPVDWSLIQRLAVEGHFLKPAGLALALLSRLGLRETLVPPEMRILPSGVARPTFDRLVRDHQLMFHEKPDLWRVLSREVLLCTEPDVAVYNAWQRFKGLLRPQSGLPHNQELRSRP